MSYSSTWTEGRPILSVDRIGQNEHLAEWLLLGPFSVESTPRFTRSLNIGALHAVDEDPIHAQETVRPVEGLPHANPGSPTGISRWERLTGERHYDLRRLYPARESAIAYAATYLACPAPVDLVILADEWDNARRCLVQVFINGVESGVGRNPILAHLPAGEHCLMLKITGGSTGDSSWYVSARVGRLHMMNDAVGAALFAPTGLWQGNESAPRAEFSAVVANMSRSVTCVSGLKASLDDQPPGPECAGIHLSPGQARTVRMSAPAGVSPSTGAVTAKLLCGETVLNADVELPELPPYGVIHVVEGFHCDPVWVSDQHHYNLVSLDNVRQLVDCCLANPSYRAFLHEIDYLKPFLDEYPDYRAAMFGLIQRGQIAVGSSYNQPNENNCSGEGLIRNIQYGDGFHRHFLGGAPLMYHAWDVFGHVPQLSQILTKSGLIGVLWSKHIHGFPPVFNHISPDGTTAIHVRTPYGWGTHSMDRLMQSTAAPWAEKHSLGFRRHLVVDSADFSSPSAWMVSKTREMAESYPAVVMTSPEEYVQGLIDDGAPIPSTSRNASQYHIGTQHSRSEMKIANRLGENALYAAEVWATFASLMGAQYPDLAIDKAWRQLLFGQHHDALTGTPCDTSYLDLMLGYRESLELSRDVVARATRHIAQSIQPAQSGESYAVFNPLSWERGDIVTLPKPDGAHGVEVYSETGEVLPIHVAESSVQVAVDRIPSVGYTTLTVIECDGSPGAPESVTEPVLENEFWRIELDPERGGGIVSLIDKESGREIIEPDAGVGNDLVALREKNRRHEPSWEFWTTGERCHASDSPAEIRIERSAVGTTAIVTGRIGDIANYRRTLTVQHGRRAIEATVRIDDYLGADDLFVVNTPVAISGALPVFEDRFCSVVARRGFRKFDYRTSGPNVYSDSAIYPVYNFVEAGWSARIDAGDESSLNLGMMGLIRSHAADADGLLTPLMNAFNHAGIGCTPYYDDDDIERLTGLETRYPKGQWENTMLPRLDDLSMAAQWLAVSIGGDNRYVSELLDRFPGEVRNRLDRLCTERGYGVVIVEDDRIPQGWPSVPVVILAANDVDAANTAISRIGEELTRTGRISLPSGCDFRVAPEPVDDYGLALLTTGTGAATLEPDGSLTLFLTHTSNWSDSHLPNDFPPEHRQMVFRYAYYPHAGSWREGGVVRAGYELNNEVTVAPVGQGPGSLPREQSFLTFTSSDAIITAIKPAANPVPYFQSHRSDPSDGIIVRSYDSSGQGASGRLAVIRPIREAFATSLTERDGQPLAVNDACVDLHLGPFSIETVKIVPESATCPVLDDACLGVTAEPVQPVWCRHWQHNQGAHPLGYLPVGIYVEGDLPMENQGGSFPTVARIRVSIVNNLTDSTISGVAEIVAPARWSALPDKIPYELGPREHMTRDVTIAFDEAPRTGLIKARMQYGGQTYQDVLEAGVRSETVISGGGSERLNAMDIVKDCEPEWTVMRDGPDIVVRVRNPWIESLDAELAIAVPPEMWGGTAGSYGMSEVSPRSVCLSIPARQTTTVRFDVKHEGEGKPLFWAWAKLMHHGKAEYRPVPGTTASHGV